jgi:hypothetical protein
MATTNPTRTAEVHRLAAQHLSHRAIARRLGIHHTTVGRILRTTTAPDAPERTTPEQPTAPERTTERTTTVTSNDDRTTTDDTLFHPRLFNDLCVLINPRTGDLPAPLARIVHQAAEKQRTAWRTAARAARTAETGRAPARAQVAP